VKIAGLEKNSFVDYPGQMAAVVFTPGCNYDCFYCHNRPLLRADVPLIPIGEVMSFLQKRVGTLEGVVVTGGEPTLQPDLGDFIRDVRRLGYLVKLDTNGSRPETVGKLLAEGLLSYVAMDYKAPFGRYPELCGPGADPLEVRETLALLRRANIAFELRTTFIPQLSVDDIRLMAEAASPMPRYALQAYRPPDVYKKEDRFRVRASPHAPADLRAAAEAAAPYAERVVVRE
jgi:pyruvate formate lyase activating enzyme